MKYKIIGAVVGFLFLPSVYLTTLIANKLDISTRVVLATLGFTVVGYLLGKLIASNK